MRRPRHITRLPLGVYRAYRRAIPAGAFPGPIVYGALMRKFTRLILPLLLALTPLPALAQNPAAAPVPVVTATAVPASGSDAVMPTPGIGQPDGGYELQKPMTPIAEEAQFLVHNFLNPMMFIITIFVVALLGYVMIRFRASKNPVASRTSHNTFIEVVWTVVPVLILVIIAVPSFRLLAHQYSPPKADITIKAIGHQWYWEYQYPDHGGFSFDSVMLKPEEAAKAGTPYLLDVDNRVVVPEGATVRVLTTSSDVIHAWMVPSFWVQMDAVPGRVNETWFKVARPGLYFGQCFQLCGTRHAFMPIAVEVVSKERFATWVAAKQKENGITPPGTTPPAAPAAAVPAVPEATPPAAVADAAPAAGAPAAPAAK